jgi:hypothetical protein
LSSFLLSDGCWESFKPEPAVRYFGDLGESFARCPSLQSFARSPRLQLQLVKKTMSGIAEAFAKFMSRSVEAALQAPCKVDENGFFTQQGVTEFKREWGNVTFQLLVSVRL